MASNSEDQVEMFVDLTSPLSSVDVSSKDRSTIQEGEQLHNCVLTQTSFSAIKDYVRLEFLNTHRFWRPTVARKLIISC